MRWNFHEIFRTYLQVKPINFKNHFVICSDRYLAEFLWQRNVKDLILLFFIYRSLVRDNVYVPAEPTWRFEPYI